MMQPRNWHASRPVWSAARSAHACQRTSLEPVAGAENRTHGTRANGYRRVANRAPATNCWIVNSACRHPSRNGARKHSSNSRHAPRSGGRSGRRMSRGRRRCERPLPLLRLSRHRPRGHRLLCPADALSAVLGLHHAGGAVVRRTGQASTEAGKPSVEEGEPMSGRLRGDRKRLEYRRRVNRIRHLLGQLEASYRRLAEQTDKERRSVEGLTEALRTRKGAAT